MSLFSLDELERQFRDHQQAQGERLQVIVMQVPGRDIEALRPRLLAQGKSLSERTRELLKADAR